MHKETTSAVTIQYESIAAWSARTGMKTGAIYAHLATGDLQAIKVGRRTLIDVEHGLQWLRSKRWKPAHRVTNRQ